MIPIIDATSRMVANWPETKGRLCLSFDKDAARTVLDILEVYTKDSDENEYITNLSDTIKTYLENN